MKILMFGRGVMATQYGWALEKAGNEVEFYVRPGRAAQYGSYVDLDLLDGRKHRKGVPVRERWFMTMREEINPDHDYDLIFLSVNHEQFEEASKIVGERAGKATILIFNNVWDDQETVAAWLPKDQILWGFPGGGGGFRGKNKLEAGFLKSIYLESAATASSGERHQSVVDLFQQAGFSVSLQKDMYAWYLEHFILNAGMAAQALKMGSYQNMYQSPQYVKPALLLMREMLPMIEAKGRKASFGTRLTLNLPASLVGYGVYKLITGGTLAGAIMERMEDTAYISHESFAFFPRDVLADARRLGIDLPRLTALEPYFRMKD
ncbi:ketopantoate reductase family protein [Peribacillus muralis]|uniref:ketopantoate reductase family protein n=1 Tax=Peribacillus muralis TaxID=264697 RepID=UPI00366F8921